MSRIALARLAPVVVLVSIVSGRNTLRRIAMPCRPLMALLACSTAAHAYDVSTDKRWNLVVVLTDDQGHWTIGAYGNRQCPTPNMDRLAREGALFTNAFSVAPLCSPSRATILTGLYPTQAGVSDVLYWTLMKRMLPPDVYEDEIRRGLPGDCVTWPELLQEEGYATGLVGKWHLGVQPEHQPTQHGFDYYFGPYLAGVLDLTKAEYQENGEKQQHEGFLTDVLTSKAVEFIEDNADEPFALVLATQVPHAPWNKVPEEDLAPLRDVEFALPAARADFGKEGEERLRYFTRHYLGLVRTVDRNLGRILATLEDHDLDDRTIVLFTSDHGFMMGHRNLIGKGTATFFAGSAFGPRRMNMFDDSIRIPLLIRWPGVVKPGTRISQLVSNLDFFPTVLAMTNVQYPATVKPEGLDMSPLLRGEKVTWRDALFGQLDVERNGFSLMRMVRTDRWKLVRHHLPLMMDELYDLKGDPGERQNLYRNPDFRQVRDELQGRLATWQRSISDPVFKVERAVHQK